MKIDTLGVQALVAIADHASFRRAAEALHITQTALSRRLQNLESFLGVKLVERTTRSVALTRLGSEFVPQARRLLSGLEASLTEIRETGRSLRGNVTIACVPTVGVHYLPRIVKKYAELHPANRVVILDHASSDVAVAVLRREAEFGINTLGAPHAELEAQALMQDRFVLVCRRDHRFARKPRLAWKQLAPHALILSGRASANRPLMEAALEHHGVQLASTYEVQRSSTALGMVLEGVGIAVVPELAVQRGAYPTLRVVPLVSPVVSRTLVLIKRRSSHLTPAAQALYDLIASKP